MHTVIVFVPCRRLLALDVHDGSARGREDKQGGRREGGGDEVSGPEVLFLRSLGWAGPGRALKVAFMWVATGVGYPRRARLGDESNAIVAAAIATEKRVEGV